MSEGSRTGIRKKSCKGPLQVQSQLQVDPTGIQGATIVPDSLFQCETEGLGFVFLCQSVIGLRLL